MTKNSTRRVKVVCGHYKGQFGNVVRETEFKVVVELDSGVAPFLYWRSVEYIDVLSSDHKVMMKCNPHGSDSSLENRVKLLEEELLRSRLKLKEVVDALSIVLDKLTI
jgi:hypothetical protein